MAYKQNYFLNASRLLQLCIYLQAKELKCLAYDSNKNRGSSNFRHIHLQKIDQMIPDILFYK